MGNPPDKAELVKISVLSKLSGVSSATIKYYIREGLLPGPALRTSRNMAWYDPRTVPRIKAIKELQRSRFLPLKVIKKILDGVQSAPNDEAVVREVTEVLRRTAPVQERTMTQLVAEGVEPGDLSWLERVGLIASTSDAQSGEARYAAEDLALIQVLTKAREVGIRPDMLPPEILLPYVEAVRNLVRMELQMFRMGVLPRAEGELPQLVESATALSEQLVVLLRRKLLLPTLEAIIREEQGSGD